MTSRDKHTDRQALTEPAEVLPVRCSVDLGQAALVLGEYRFWATAEQRFDLDEDGPVSRREYATLARMYRPPGGLLFLARVHGEPVGVVGLQWLASGVGELKRMYVRQPARGHGLGRRLLEAAVAAAIELGYQRLYLQVDTDLMPAAARLYREVGFREIGLADAGLTSMELGLRAGISNYPDVGSVAARHRD